MLVAAPRDGTLLFVSPAITQLLGHDARAWLGRPITELADAQDAERLRDRAAGVEGDARTLVESARASASA